MLASQFAVLAGIAAYVLFGERLTRFPDVGVSLVVAGVAVLAAVRA